LKSMLKRGTEYLNKLGKHGEDWKILTFDIDRRKVIFA
jgi:hypothetical protein